MRVKGGSGGEVGGHMSLPEGEETTSAAAS